MGIDAVAEATQTRIFFENTSEMELTLRVKRLILY